MQLIFDGFNRSNKNKEVICLEIHRKKKEGNDEGIKEFLNFIRFLSNDKVKIHIVFSIENKSSNAILILQQSNKGDYTNKTLTMIEFLKDFLEESTNYSFGLKEVNCAKHFFLY